MKRNQVRFHVSFRNIFNDVKY